MAPATLHIMPDDRTLEVEPGTCVADALRAAGIALTYPCGGVGRCGGCRVRFQSGAPEANASERRELSDEERARGERLACQCRVAGAARLTIPALSRPVEPRILTASGFSDVALDPAVTKHFLRAEAATIARPLADADVVAELLALNAPAASSGRAGDATSDPPAPTLPYLAKLPYALRAARGDLTVTCRDGEAIDVEPGDTATHVYGVAVDLGTTTVVARLHSLRTGERLAVAAALNPQIAQGEDVISRLHRAFQSPAGLRRLQTAVIECLDDLTTRLCSTAGVSNTHIYEYAVAGNTAMNHLLLGVAPENIGLAPYAPVFRHVRPVRAGALGLRRAPEAHVVVLPNIGGFVGGDTVAGLLAADFAADSPGGSPGTIPTGLFIDIGTNCEVALRHGDRLAVASAPAGPAMEGACIAFGMRAEAGAIEDVAVEGDRLCITTIDGAPARGLCGSGLVHAVVALRRAGIVQARGTMDATAPDLPAALAGRIERDGPDGPRLLLAAAAEGAARDVWLTQKDVREFQLARAAIVAAWRMLCAHLGIDETAIEEVVIAGAFGSFLRPEAAREIGLTPRVDPARVRSLGNAALEGAHRVLLNRSIRALAATLPARAECVELAGRPDFDELFALELALETR